MRAALPQFHSDPGYPSHLAVSDAEGEECPHAATSRFGVRYGFNPLFLLFFFIIVPIISSNAFARIYVSPTKVAFGNVVAGSSVTQQVSLINLGGSSVTVSRVAVTGAAFKLSSLTVPFTLGARRSVTVRVTFAPTVTGAASGSLVAGGTSWSSAVSLSGTGISLQLGASPTSLSFGSVAVGSSSARTVTLTNSGTSSVTVSQATVAGTGFSVSGLSLPLALGAGKTVSISVTYAPTAAGSATGSVSIVSNAANSPVVVALSGSAGTLLLGASPTSLSFGSVTVGSNSAQTVTLTNSGTSSVTVSAATATGTGYSASGLSLPVTLAAGKSTSFSVTFAPTAAGSATGSVSVVSNATNSPATVSLSGTGSKLKCCDPVPDSETVAGEFVALLITETLPVVLPAAVGAKVTLNDVLFPAARVSGNDRLLVLNPVPVTAACRDCRVFWFLNL